jgi:hypothetical protein
LIHRRGVEKSFLEVLPGAPVVIMLRQNRDLAQCGDSAEQDQHEHAELRQAQCQFSHFRFPRNLCQPAMPANAQTCRVQTGDALVAIIADVCICRFAKGTEPESMHTRGATHFLAMIAALSKPSIA